MICHGVMDKAAVCFFLYYILKNPDSKLNAIEKLLFLSEKKFYTEHAILYPPWGFDPRYAWQLSPQDHGAPWLDNFFF